MEPGLLRAEEDGIGPIERAKSARREPTLRLARGLIQGRDAERELIEAALFKDAQKVARLAQVKAMQRADGRQDAQGARLFLRRLEREIKQAVSKLPPRKKLALVRWLQTQVDDRLNDEEMMAIAAEGARALDKREAAYAKRKAR